jgi:glycine/D-amino acid oxidase-like deaminating enzyme
VRSSRREPLPRQANVSWWMEEARADPALAASEPCPPLAGEARADVVILGGGYTGLWTAWFLKEREPSLDIVLLEADELCASGPSGRNGGFCYGMWEDLPALVRHLGDDDAVRMATAADGSVVEIGEWLRAHDVDAWFTRAGHLTVATSPAQDGAWREVVDQARRLRLDEALFVELTPKEVSSRCASPVFRGGLLQPQNATLQPARLALGLRRELLARGVRIHEASPVTRFSAGPLVVVETTRGAQFTAETTSGGRVTAERGVLALGAWTSALRAFHRAIVPRGTYIVISEPAPERLEEIGWTGGEGLGDWRTALHYFRATPDGRIAFGAAAATAGLGVDLGPRLRFDAESVAKLIGDFRRFFPSWNDVRLEAAWGGPMDVTGLHQPFFGTMPGGALHYGAGFTGGGVGPCHLAGKILSGLALRIEDEHTTLPLVRREPMQFPPEPIRSIGAALAQGAIVRKDEAHDAGRRPGPLTSLLASLPRRLGYELGP